MIIKTATLIPGSETPVGDGYTQAMRCVLHTSEGQTRAAVLKRLPRPAVLAEAFSAVLLRAWGLTVPDPFLVPEGDQLHFASADATYPSLKQRLGISPLLEDPIRKELIKAASYIVAGLDQTPLALMADEAIDNRDRNLGNILWDGEQVAWIDHELTLDLANHLDDANKLALIVQSVHQHEAVRQSAIAAWMALDRTTPNTAAICAGEDTRPFADFVAGRLNALGTRLLHRFPTPNDLLLGA